ncbi:MAG TPA: M14 metallopeptidase family protein [Vicinamibacterales bacterium]|nr:M14 metallopeptidase family protein [Vicinamibacterales bacterium]
MRSRNPWRLVALLLILLLAGASVPQAQQKITTPRDALGFDAGEDYHLANYTQLLAYLKTLDQESDRLQLVEIGKSAEGRPMVMAIITAPGNHARLEHYRDISRRLALAEGLTDDEARALAREGKAVVWIDGGLHGTEVVPAQGLFEMAHQMVSRQDPETLRILDDVILLLLPVNPDGMDLVSNWYMREQDPKRRTTAGLPRLYQKYVGHDNNRDSYMANQPETAAINRQMFVEWIPQIMYNQHQTGPAGTVLFAPPFRDPFNYNYDPLVPMGIELVGAAIHNRFIQEGKAGAVSRNEASYSTWYNGGVRTTTGFHNQIGILTEIIGNPTPMQIPFIPARLLPDTSKPYPILPQAWHQKQSIDYLMTCNRAILDIASRLREDFLYRIYRMGKNSIARGSTDHWTLTPRQIAAVQAAAAADGPGPSGPAAQFGGRGGGIDAKYFELLRKPENRDPRGYIIPSDQPDFLTATKFVNVLIKGGVQVHRATAAFAAGGKEYPAGSYVVKAAQAFRPHLRDLFEPQDHPDDIPYPGGPPRPPYDATGWTVAFQMGVQFDRLLDGFDGPFEKLPMALLPPPPAPAPAARAAAYLLDHRVNDAFVATNRLLAANEEVYWLKAPLTTGGTTWPAGTIYVPAKASTRPLVEALAKDLGLRFGATPTRARGEALKLKPLRVGLWDRYGGSMDSGWIRWMLEQAFPTSFEVVFPPTLDAGNLNARYDVIIFPDGAVPALAGAAGRGPGGGAGGAPTPQNVPEEFRGQIGNVTADKTVPQLRQFLEGGGTIIAIGTSSNLAQHLGLPVHDHLAERQANGTDRRMGSEKYFIPGSILRVAVDTTHPLAWGIDGQLDVFFDNSPVFRLAPHAAMKGVRPVAWFDSSTPLRSGRAWGQSYLQGGVAAVDAEVGKGRLFLFGPEITFRAQPHGTFKFLFNGMYLGSATGVTLR